MTISVLSSTSCSDKKSQSSESKIKEDTKTVTTMVTEAYKEIDFLESIHVTKISDLYPYCKVYISASDEEGILGILSPNIFKYSVECLSDTMNITINLPITDDNKISNISLDEKKIHSINNIKQIPYNISEIDTLLFKEEQYTKEIDNLISNNITSYFTQIGVDFSVTKKYLYVYSNESELNEVNVRHESLDNNSVIPLELYSKEYGLKTICYSSSKNKYYLIPVVLHLKNNELVDYYVKYSDASLFAYNNEEECLNALKKIYSDKGKLVEYTK